MSRPSRSRLFADTNAVLERFRVMHEARKAMAAKAMKTPMTSSQLLVLKRLVTRWRIHKTDAKRDRKRFAGGWVHLRYDDKVHHSSLMNLVKRGLAMTCCEGHQGRDHVRVTEAGLRYFDSHIADEGLGSL